MEVESTSGAGAAGKVQPTSASSPDSSTEPASASHHGSGKFGAEGDGDDAQLSAQKAWQCLICKAQNRDCASFVCDSCQAPAQNLPVWPPSERRVRAPRWRCALWRPQLYVHPEHPDIQWAFASPDDWLFTASWDYRLMNRLLESGLFTIPDTAGRQGDAMLMLPNPQNRYCIDLKAQTARPWASGKPMRPSKRSRYRISVNRDFTGGLRCLMAGHDVRSSTWMTEDLIDVFDSMNHDPKSVVKHWLFELWIPVDDVDGVEQNLENDVQISNATSDGPGDVKTRTAADSVAVHKMDETTVASPESGEPSTPDATGGAVAKRDGDGSDGHNEEDTVWQLAAVTAGMSAGSNFHDYSMCTFVRDSRCLGHVLTKTVADLLQKCDFDLWYWGYKGEYMSQYDHYGGRNVPREEFWRRWQPRIHSPPKLNLVEVLESGSALLAPLDTHAQTKLSE